MAKNVKRIKPGELDSALKEVLESYAADVIDRVNVASEDAARKLVRLTRQTAPVGTRKRHFRSYITYSEDTNRAGRFVGKTYVWHVKRPEYRLTHLLVRPHRTGNGGQTRGNPFLHNAVDTVAQEYEAQVREAIERGN